MSLRTRALLATSAAWLAWAAPADAGFVNPIPDPIPIGSLTVGLEPVVSGLVAPNTFVPARDGTGRSFVVDQTGQIRVVQNGALREQPFLDISSQLVPLVPFYDERGLLGMALHPNFARNGKFYTYHSAPVSGPADFSVPVGPGEVMNHQSVVTEWTVDPAQPDQVNAGSGRVIMRVDKPQMNHNGGALDFGPDGNLYISIGDGGGADDQNGNANGPAWGPEALNGHAPEGNAQNMQTVLGKVLRINVDGEGAPSANGQYTIPADNPFTASGDGIVDEIFASGFRNPFRLSFASDGRLIVGDVGQENVEEIDDVVGGGNYGWRVKEGGFLFNPNGTDPNDSTVTIPGSPGVPAGLIDPLLQYDHGDGEAVIGGFVYDGAAIPELLGLYIFGDLSANLEEDAGGRLFAGDLATGEIFSLLPGTLSGFLKGFGVDANGEIYALVSGNVGPTGATGVILRLVPFAVPEPGSVSLIGLGVLAMAAARRRRPIRAC